MVYCPPIVDLDSPPHPYRRRQSRYALRSLCYVKLEQANGGIVRDLTESGIAIQAVAPLQVGREIKVSFDVLSPRVRVDASGRVAWADPGGQAGIEFSALAPRTQRALRDWIFTQMLSAAAITGRDSMFQSLEPQLIMSAASRAAIVMDPPKEDEAELPRVSWGFLSLSQRTFSRFIDIVVLLCALLLFSISSLAVMGGLPAWPIATALFLTTSLIFIVAYQLLFSELLCGASPGRRLAMLAAIQSEEEAALQRFR